MASAPVTGPAKLVEVDRDDEDRAHRDLLPERLDADDDEAVLQDGRDEDADDRPDDRADAAEQARATDDDRGDRVEVVRRMAADRGRAEARQGHEAGQPGQ